METKNAWKNYKSADIKKVDSLSREYIDFLSDSKTERECVDNVISIIEKAGYINLDEAINKKQGLKAGDKIYAVNMNKNIAMFNIGQKSIIEGMNILGAHIDSPRLDVKQNPLFEDGELAYFDTHYYGGIKKYQWVTIPLALHGVIVKKDGSIVEVNIGEDKDDPVFFVSDLLIHLASEQMEKKASKVVEGEALDIIIGHKPLVIDNTKDKKNKNSDSATDKQKDGVKDNIIDILAKEYGVSEDDLLSAEIEVVPAGRAREAGLDRSLVLGYGHDDRVCAFPSMKAMLNVKNVERTACCLLVDKEEIGSVGATGMQSRFFENNVAKVMNLLGEYSELNLRSCLQNSAMLSSDVSAGFDPTYASCFEKKNAAFLGHGMVFNKFTGARGKSGSNDSNAEYMAHIRDVMDKGKVAFQTAELGKVDIGGGGTIAYIMALYGMNVIDAGIAVLNMHAPWEAISKADLYETLKGYEAFLKYCTI